MKDKFLLAIAIILLPIEFELQTFGLSVMNQPDSFAFWLGVGINLISFLALGFTGFWAFTLTQTIYKQSKEQKNEQN